MTGWNMPPGCNVSDIPGNSCEELAWVQASEELDEALAKINADPDEIKLIGKIAPIIIETAREIVKHRVQDALADNQMYINYLKEELRKRGWKD